MTIVEHRVCQTLRQDPARRAIEFEGQWYCWDELRRVAEQVDAAIEASGADRRAPVAFVSRNRPVAVAALLGLLARSRPIQMIYAFQSPIAIARNIEELKPAALVACAEDIPDDVRNVLVDLGIATVSLEGMAAKPLAGLERSTIDARALPSPEIGILTSGTTGPPKRFAVTTI